MTPSSLVTRTACAIVHEAWTVKQANLRETIEKVGHLKKKKP